MPGFFDVDERLKELSAEGDDLERIKSLVDFELFRSVLEAAVPRGDRSKGGRPAFDPVLMFKVLILQAMHSLAITTANVNAITPAKAMPIVAGAAYVLIMSPDEAELNYSHRCSRPAWLGMSLPLRAV